jgi:Carboxypeptidase regulatory-like domain
MNALATKAVVTLGVFALCMAISGALQAQDSGAALSGTVTGPSGAPVANAKIAAKNVATGQSIETQTDARGHYNLPSLTPGDYEIEVTAEGFTSQTNKLTFTPGAALNSDFALIATASEVKLPESPAAKSTEPTLEDLGFTPGEAKGTAQDQARLDKRSHMLKLHQRFGLIATVPLIATVATSFGAGGRSTSTSDRWAHMALGSATGDLYFISAYYALRAPKIQGTQTRGPIRLHKALAWIHGPGMILTPILGAIAFDQKSKGEKVHGIAQAHGPVAIVTAAAYGVAIASVSFKF